MSSWLPLVIQATWLVLCGMMLFSRFVFQAAGAVWMRAFLDTWKVSRTHRVWGLAALAYGCALAAGVVMQWGALTAIDRALGLALVAVLSADGLLNLLPAWFGHFKERMQDAWVKRHRDTGRAGDEHLFGRVNLLLGLASVGVAALVYVYRPLPAAWLIASAAIAMLVMAALIVACRHEGRRPSESAG